jgi:hypothetical protein
MSAMTNAPAWSTTPESVETRIGVLEVDDGAVSTVSARAF